MTTTERTPVFVDPSGRRRRVLRVLIGAAVAGVLVYLALLAVALSGGPVKPSSLLPIPAAESAPATTTAVAPTSAATTEVARPVVGERTSARTTDRDEPTTTATTAETPAPTPPNAPGGKRNDPPGASNRPTPPGKG